MLFVASAGAAVVSETLVQGIVRDSITLEGIPYASVSVRPGGKAVVADSRGLFSVVLDPGSSELRASSQGYAPKVVPVVESRINLYDIMLVPEAKELKELVVKKARYSKRNNPAVDFARKLKEKGAESDPRKKPDYSYDRYERIVLGLHDFDTTSQNVMMRKMPFLIEHVDTSEISGKPVLALSLKETAGTEFWRKNEHRSLLTGQRGAGVDEFIDGENMMTMLTEILREVDLYDSQIVLMKNNFVSPLSAAAPDFYRFYLVDSTAVVPDTEGPHIALAFYPRNKSSFCFTGHVYVPANDKTMPISRIDMHVPDDINLNFVKDLNIVQTYKRTPGGTRLKERDDMIMTLQAVPGTPEVYVSRKISYDNHSFEHSTIADSLFAKIGEKQVDREALDRDELFWANMRSGNEQAGENNTALLMERLCSKKVFYWGEKVLKVLVNGYITTGKDSKFDFGPVNTFASYNSFEGFRLRAGGMTTANLSKHIFGRGYLAYGFGDHKWKYSAEAEYSFNEKRYHAREWPIHSLRLSHRYDVDRLGSHYLYTNADNFVLSLSRLSDKHFSYRRDTELRYTLELRNNLSFGLTAAHSRQEASRWLSFIKGDGQVLDHFGETWFEAEIRYAPGEKFYQSGSYRIPVSADAPVFTLRHRFAAKGFAGTAFGINRTEISASKRFRMSFLGSLDLAAEGGHVWGETPFTELLIPNANLSYTIQPRSFALMNPMEFINSSYVGWHATWQLRGLIFNLIPGVKKLGLREVVSFNGMWGQLSKRNNPKYNPSLLVFPEECGDMKMDKPYMELSAGLDNIFRILRVDYVWRLSYRNVPYSIDRSGVRVALHFTF